MCKQLGRETLSERKRMRKQAKQQRKNQSIGLGFDPGLNLGWSVIQFFEDDSTTQPIVIESGVVKNDSDVPIGQRLLELFSFTLALFIKYKPALALVGIEQVNKARGAAIKKGNDHTWTIYFVYGMLLMLAHAFNIRCEKINPMTMKAQFTLDGHADKAVVRTKAQTYLKPGEKIQRSDQSDAIGIAIVAWMVVFNLLLDEKQRAEKKRHG